MKRVCNMVMAAGLLVASAAEAQSLADVAKQEQERRKSVKEPARVYTEADVQKTAPLTTAAARPQPAAAEPGAATAADGTAGASSSRATATATPAAAPDAATKAQAEAPTDEAGWRARLQGARDELARGKRLLTAMEAQLVGVAVRNANALVTGQPAPNTAGEREAVKEVERLRADVEKFAAALAQVESDAKIAGIPPGWLR